MHGGPRVHRPSTLTTATPNRFSARPDTAARYSNVIGAVRSGHTVATLFKETPPPLREAGKSHYDSAAGRRTVEASQRDTAPDADIGGFELVRWVIENRSDREVTRLAHRSEQYGNVLQRPAPSGRTGADCFRHERPPDIRGGTESGTS